MRHEDWPLEPRLATRGSCLATEWLNFRPAILEHFCPLFIWICQMGSHFAQMGLHFAQITTPNPCSLLRRHTCLRVPFRGYVLTQRTTNPTPKHPFAWPELESGKMNYRLGNLHSIWAIRSKSVLKFSRKGKRKYSWLLSWGSGHHAPPLSSLLCGRPSAHWDVRQSWAQQSRYMTCSAFLSQQDCFMLFGLEFYYTLPLILYSRVLHSHFSMSLLTKWYF